LEGHKFQATGYPCAWAIGIHLFGVPTTKDFGETGRFNLVSEKLLGGIARNIRDT